MALDKHPPGTWVVTHLQPVEHHKKTAILLGLAALGPDARPSYDRQMAERLAAGGMDIAALTWNFPDSMR